MASSETAASILSDNRSSGKFTLLRSEARAAVQSSRAALSVLDHADNSKPQKTRNDSDEAPLSRRHRIDAAR